MARVLHRADAALLRLTNDRYTFTEFVGLPILRLTTTGAKTGRPRTSLLIAVSNGNRIALIASNFGRKRNPAWYYNLKTHPECKMEWSKRAGIFVAREIEGDEYDKYWELAVSYYAGYERYRERAAHRHIPVMLLEPKQ